MYTYMLIISVILLILVIVAAVIRESKPEHAGTANKILVILVVLALINFALTMMGII